MAHDVDLVSGVFSLCCGNRATTRRPLPIQKFTWERHYLVDGTSERKDLSSKQRSRNLSTPAPKASNRGTATRSCSHGRGVQATSSDDDFDVQETNKAQSADPDHHSKSKSDPGHTRLDSLGNVAKDPGHLESITSAIGSSFAALANSLDHVGDTPGHDDVEDKVDRKQLVKEMRIAAQSLEGPVQKYPKTGRGLLAAPQERYFVALPELSNSHYSGSDSQSGRDAPPKTDIGTLSYWGDQQEYLAKKQPKGVIPLRQIARVHYSKDSNSGCCVNLKHKCDQAGGDTCELQLKFPSKRAAEEWSYNLSQFLIKLRTLHGME